MLLNATCLLERETKLIQECISGRRHSQNELYSLYAPKMLGVCMRYARTKEEAEEILQEGFMQVFSSLRTFRHEGSFEGWIRRIMVFTCIKHYRGKGKMYPILPAESMDENACTDETATAEISTKELMKMVQQLPPAYRLVFNLYVFEGMKHREIAELLGISEGTSKSNLYDAKALLQKAIISSQKIFRQSI